MLIILIPCLVVALLCVFSVLISYRTNEDFKNCLIDYKENIYLWYLEIKWAYRGKSLKYRLRAYDLKSPVRW